MEIKLTQQESEQLFYNSLCNALGYMQGYGLGLEVDKESYQTAKANLQQKRPGETICYEDVLLQVLKDGGSLTMVDHEGDGEYNSTVTLQDIHDRVQKTESRFLMDMINEQDDAETADVILQTVFFGEPIFG